METTAYYEFLRAGKYEELPPASQHPRYSHGTADSHTTPAFALPPYVARKQELDTLARRLDVALSREGSVVLISGDACPNLL